jgi:soluble lytic murein transglycosylase
LSGGCVLLPIDDTIGLMNHAAALLICIATLARLPVMAAAPVDLATITTRDAMAAAAAELMERKRLDPAAFAAEGMDYLLGRTLEASGDVSAAAAAYHTVAAGRSPLRANALFRLSRIARGSGDLFVERLYLNELAAFYPETAGGRAARTRLARNWFDSGMFAESAAVLTGRLPSTRPAPPTGQSSADRGQRLLLARAYLNAAKPEAARPIFEEFMPTGESAAGDDALEAVRGLDRIDAAGAVHPEFDAAEHRRRASVYLANREFIAARQHYEGVLNRDPGSELIPEVVYQIGRTYALAGNWPEAIKWYERVLEQHAEHQAARDALLQSASAYARVGRHRESIARYQRFIEKYPADARLDRAYLNTIDVLRDQGEETEAIKSAQRVEEIFRGKLTEAQAAFARARIHLAQSDWQNALATLDRVRSLPNLGGTSVPGGTSVAEVDLLRGIAFEQMRRFREAVATYLSIPDGRGEYFGWRATERLRALAQNKDAAPIVAERLASLSASAAADPEATRRDFLAAFRLASDENEQKALIGRLRRIREPSADRRTGPERQARKTTGAAHLLLSLGLFDEAFIELESTGSSPATAVRGGTAAGDVAFRVISFADAKWRDLPPHQPLELLPAQQARMIYPAPFAIELVESASARGLDPRFLLAIMRQESAFRIASRSGASARGLMQFIPETANRVAGELRLTTIRHEDLYDPEIALLFGAQYTADLFRAFPNQPQAVAAAYNGGEDNMSRWMGRSRSDDPDRYVSEILYSQSKDYVMRVMSNYRMYRFLYDEKLHPAEPAIQQK